MSIELIGMAAPYLSKEHAGITLISYSLSLRERVEGIEYSSYFVYVLKLKLLILLLLAKNHSEIFSNATGTLACIIL
jgi:hypothetical protein